MDVGKLLTGVESFFGEAFDLIQLGAKAYSALSGDDKEEQQQGFMKPDFAKFRTSAARASQRNMDQPFGLRPALYPENVENAMRSMAERQLRDSTLQQVRDVAAVRRSNRINTQTNVNMANTLDITPAGARAAQVSRARIRNTMGA